MKVKDRVRNKMATNNRPSKRAQIEVITLEEDEAPIASTSSGASTKSTRQKRPTTESAVTSSSSSTENTRKSNRRRSKPLVNIVNTLNDLVNIRNKKNTVSADSGNSSAGSNPLKRSKGSTTSIATTASSASSGCASLDSNNQLIDLDSDDDLDEIEIIEVVEKDCHTISFMNSNTTRLNETRTREEIAVIEHIQHDLHSREKKLKTKVGHAVVYTDGSCREYYNTGEQIAGIGVFWGHNDKRNVSELIRGEGSSNRAEIQAAIRAIQTAIEYKYEFVTVYTDR
jgi:hypothetical protein